MLMMVSLMPLAGCRAGQAGSGATTGPEAQARIAQLEERLERLEERTDGLDQVVQKFPDLVGALMELADAVERIETRGVGQLPPQRPTRPDPDVVYSVPVSKDDPSEGPKHAKVTIVKAYEYACPFCYRVLPTIEQIQDKYGNDVRVVYKHYIVHPEEATPPARAACAAHLEGKFEAMNDLLWEKAFAAGRNFSEENIMTLAREAGVKNMKRFKARMEGVCAQKVAADQQALNKVGVRGTPAFFINGRPISGAQPYESFEKVIDEELERANQALKEGAKLNRYYDSIVESGQPEI